ncbi:phage tail protein [Calothrix sp. PCC 6303]|uniref:phage tail protein n=1 Tax=Calothrix sp. PCC 6303 TaxID=1170562 RepID=UPI0002A0570B|nr:phage tail protein [Calothrix sp. PCC 6303]AFZ01387.1 phage tail protein [Calothrix sp. PCC 6303]
MTQSQSSQLIDVRLTPMQIPDAVPSKQGTQSGYGVGIKASTSAIASRQISLQLRPGEASEMVVQVKNLGNRPLQLELKVQGDFPANWCRIGMEGLDILPGTEMEAVLYFQISNDFFESPTALQPGESLKLNYQGHLYAYSMESDSGKNQVECIDFNLYVRPPSLYLDFLPGIYRDVDFIGRFLKIFEQSFEPCVHTVENISAYLNPLTAPTAFLPFLSYWVGWKHLPQISPEKERYLIKSAIEIFRWRGTRRGLRFFLHLVTQLPLDEDILNEEEKHISITESFSRGFVFGETLIGESSIVGGGCPFHFTIILRPNHQSEIDDFLVKNIIEQEKPAFCTYDLYIQSTER